VLNWSAIMLFVILLAAGAFFVWAPGETD
jgi:hypothetical protein